MCIRDRYYDRYLPRCTQAVKIGVALEVQRVPRAAVDAHDPVSYTHQMCIRDSLCGLLALAQLHHGADHLIKTGVVRRVDDLGSGNIKVTGGGSSLALCLVAHHNDLQPVSYTHLDVYKRQMPEHRPEMHLQYA